MADRDVTVDIIARDRTGGPVKKAAEEFNRLGNTAIIAQRRIDDLGDETGRLSRQMLEAKAAARLLGKEFERTGDTKLLKDIEKINRDASRLGRILRNIEPDQKAGPSFFTRQFGSLIEDARKAGLIAGDAVVEGVGDAFNAIPGEFKIAVVGGLAAAAAVAAPVIAGAIEGAVLAGFGAGAIAGGVLIASQEAHVAAAFSKLGDNVMQGLKTAAKPFESLLLNSAQKFGAAFDEQLPRISRIFATAAKGFDPILDGILDGVRELMPAIERAVAASIPILRDLGAQLPGLAAAMGNLIDGITAAGPGAAVALHEVIAELTTLINVMAIGAQASAPMLNALGKLAELTGMAGGTVKQLSTIVPPASQQALLAANDYNLLAQSMGNTANQAKALDEAFNRLFTEQMNVDQANLAVNVGMTQLRDTINQNKKTLDQHTAAGQANVGVILQQIQNIERKRQADIAAGNGTAEASAKANAAYASQIGELRKLLVQMGFAEQEVDNLIAAYGRIPRTITTTISTVFRTTGTPPGYSDQLTGHSRTGREDYGAGTSWAAFRHAETTRAEMSGESGGSAGGFNRSIPATEVNTEVVVNLDGRPFDTKIARAVSRAEQRQAWRAKVGRR